MNLKFVETFVWVARLKSITRAAEKLCLTQSAVSNRIAALENELGAELIDRRNPSFRLSDAGMRFVTYADALLAVQSELKNELGTPEQRPFSLRIGAIESVLHSWLIPLVDALKHTVPRINFELTVDTTLNLLDQIRRGSLDLVFCAAPAQKEGLVTEALEPFEMVFVGAESMAGKPRLSLSDLLEHDIMTFQRGSQPHIGLVDALHTRGIDDKYIHTISSISALTLLAGSGFGISTLPRPVVERLPSDGNRLCILDTALPLDPLPLHASYWSDPANPTLKHAIREALAFARNYKHFIARRSRPKT